MQIKIKINQQITQYLDGLGSPCHTYGQGLDPFSNEDDLIYMNNLYEKLRKFFRENPEQIKNHYHIKAGGTYETRPVRSN